MTRARRGALPDALSLRLDGPLLERLEAAVARERERLVTLGIDETAAAKIATTSSVIRRLLDAALAAEESAAAEQDPPTETRGDLRITA